MNGITQEEQEIIQAARVWDKDRALSQLNDNTELLDRIVYLYLEKVPEIFIELDFFINNSHLKEIHPLAHDLKDLSRSVGAGKVAEIAKILETQHNVKSQEDLVDLFQILSNEFESFKKLIQ